MYKLKKGTVVAFVIGALGAVSDLFEKYTGKLNVTIRLEMIQKAALLGTAALLRKVLAVYGLKFRDRLWDLGDPVAACSRG